MGMCKINLAFRVGDKLDLLIVIMARIILY